MQKAVHFSVVATIIATWLLAVATPMLAIHLDVARAQATTKSDGAARALTCAKVFKDRCNNMPVGENNLLACFDERVKSLPAACVELAKNFARMCDSDVHRLCKGVVEGKGNIIDCLKTSKRSVSAQCNAAIDAAHLRD